MNSRKLLCLCSLLALSGPAALLAGDFSLQLAPTQDNTLYEVAGGTLANGVGTFLFAGVVDSTGNNTRRRALLAFNVHGILPDDAVITGAQLTLNMSMSIIGETDVTLHRVTSDWGAADSDAPGQEGQGGAAMTGDATWQHAFFDTVDWTALGGDFDASASATTPVAAGGSYTWGSTVAMVSDVQGWLAEPVSDFGWIVVGEETLAPTAKRFDSQENSTAANRPRLLLSFSSTSLVFLDNFESGNVSGWSSSVP